MNKGSKYKPVVGERFANYVIISSEVISRKGYATINVRCDCGNEQWVDAYSLYSKRMKRCYKCNKRYGRDNKRWKGYHDISGSFWNRIQKQAMERDIEFSLTMEEVWDQYIKQRKRCALSGRKIYFTDKTASIDRIDSKLGYIIGNIQVVHKDINLMKNYFDQDYFIKTCNEIVLYATHT